VENLEQSVYDTLERLNIPFVRYEHEPVFTMEGLEKVGITDGLHCKNLFLRNKKGDSHYLVVVGSAKRVNLKDLSEQIGSTPLSFASEERLSKHLGLSAGAVSPFGLLNDREKTVRVLIDRDLVGADNLCVHPNVNTATVRLSWASLERFLGWCGNAVTFIRV